MTFPQIDIPHLDSFLGVQDAVSGNDRHRRVTLSVLGPPRYRGASPRRGTTELLGARSRAAELAHVVGRSGRAAAAAHLPAEYATDLHAGGHA